MLDITLTLIGKPSCHLCDDARLVVNDVVTQLQNRDDGTIRSKMSRLIVDEVSIEEDRSLFDEYWEQIPVLLINGKVHNFWRIDPVRLTNSLKELL
ncbi:MAG: glutaredoxin family protein [Actinomycetales bacterium]|nr:glutaredoxin family protein [Actinomycetales bacterium]